jgi:hypothetical protein
MDSTGARSRWEFIPTVLLLAVGLLFFRDVLLGGQAFFSRDIAPFFYPMKDFLARSVRAGELPLWNPWLLNGEPFFATLQPGVLYPGNLLLYVLPMPFAFGLTLILHYPLAGIGMYCLLRVWGYGRAASLLGGFGWMLGGYFVSIGNFPNNLGTVAWAPWLIVAWSLVVERRSLRRVLAFALLCAVAFLGGEPQMLAIVLVLALLHTLAGAERTDGDAGPMAQFGLYAGAGALALGLVAVQLLPFVELVGESVRSLTTEIEFSAGRSLEPASLTQLLVPPVLDAGLYGFTTRRLPTMSTPWLLSLYAGVPILIFAAAGVASARSRRWAMFWLIAAALGVALALGVHSPVYRALYDWVPLLRPFRYPEKFFFLTALALPVLAAGGVDSWLEDRVPVRRVLVPTAVVVASLAAAWTWLRVDASLFPRLCDGVLSGALMCGDPVAAQRDYLQPIVISLTMAALTGLTVIVRRLGHISTKLAAALVVALVVVDLAVANHAVNPSVDSEIFTEPAWTVGVVRDLQPDPQAWRFRGSSVAAAMGSMVSVMGAWELSNMYLDFQTLGPNLGQLYGVMTQDGLQGVELESVSMSVEAVLGGHARNDPIHALRAMNVRYYSDPTAAADSLGLNVVATHPELPIRIFEIDDPLPRAYVVSEFEIAESAREALRGATSGGFPLAERVFLEERPGAALSPGALAVVVDGRYGTDEVRIRTAGSGPALLVLTDRYYPGWKAAVNGAETQIYRANGIFRAVVVPSGAAEVVFRFDPLSVRIGAWISALTLLTVIGLLLVAAGRRWRG